ncbi:MAG: hypothetical protein IJR48_02965 [Oscillibacter sp.]|nr:hypothetical protein [Oscillibacter sp.]MBQ7680617.1 hypothetical protein [Oscillibacter sp.]MBQ9617302.1 hypothetical protein [Oscillibacter sp.]
MDYAEERRFVRLFVRKSRRERLLYELTNPGKRYDGLSRFCHHAGKLLDARRILLSGEDLERQAAFRGFVEGHDEACFILSPDFSLDGRTARFSAALGLASGCFDAAIILGGSFAVVYGEVMKGGRGKYLLTAEGRKLK